MFVQCASRVLLAHQLSHMGVFLKCFGEREHHGVVNGEADLGDPTRVRASVRHQWDSSSRCTVLVQALARTSLSPSTWKMGSRTCPSHGDGCANARKSEAVERLWGREKSCMNICDPATIIFQNLAEHLAYQRPLKYSCS